MFARSWRRRESSQKGEEHSSRACHSGEVAEVELFFVPSTMVNDDSADSALLFGFSEQVFQADKSI
jgi:hypothetical protein